MDKASSGRCGSFTLSNVGVVISMRWLLYCLPYLAAAITLISLLTAAAIERFRKVIPVRKLALSLTSFVIGNGLITNLFLKRYYGRPRPFQTDLFGGSFPFIPAGSFHGACHQNCSFPSGEASGAGWLICLIVLVPERYRLWVAPPVIVAAVTTAILRVAVGAHYASDAVLGLLLSITVSMGIFALDEQLPIINIVSRKGSDE
ncbi:phosphatase PAP2 family protein [Oryzifoliimicrobium ureilyticus]|uniref:phosphatase PAP2 family protein n=1 Tax=Oryzifoliimicrobium ureilyticus TaxID=3113724 RepID=UPI0030761EB9